MQAQKPSLNLLRRLSAVSSDKKHGLGRGISSLFGGDFSLDEQVDDIISRTTGAKTSKAAEAPASKAEKKSSAASKDKTALAPEAEKEAANSISAVYVPLSSVSANPNQPRKAFNPEAIAELAESIKSQGIIQPLIVEEIIPGKYSIIAGERRFRAAKEAGLKEIPVIVRKLSELERIQMSLIENIQRENLNPIEEATAYQYLIQRSGMTQEQVAEKVGKSRSTIANSLRLLSLNDSIKDDIISGIITAGHARAILSLVNPSDQALLRSKIVDGDLSVREAERLADEYNKGHKFVQKKKSKDDDPEVSEVVEKFISAVGARCDIKGTLSKGRLTIRFRSQQDLERIYGLISGGEELFTE